ncbi:MAG: TetR/AcrR family transcriptional regulator [Chloroflexota bacterium]|nr:TetR/AcrR family transcriptional regulator [Chloroflexota bacterium]
MVPQEISEFETRRQRRIARKRIRIMKAAAQVFAEKGYHHTTTREIAQVADMAEGTLYNYFAEKREILLSIVEEVLTSLTTLLGKMETFETRDDIVVFVEMIFDVLSTKLAFARTLVIEAWLDDVILQDLLMERMTAILELVEGFITTSIAEGRFRPMNPHLATRMLFGMFVGPLLPVLRGIEAPPTLQERHALAAAAVNLLMDGIQVREG